MSLGDKLRLLRAQRGGIMPSDIEAALPDLPKGLYRQLEQRYRALGDDETIGKLAAFYGVPFEDLRWRRDWPRKALSRSLVQALDQKSPIRLELWNGETVSGNVTWWDLGAVGVQTAAGELVIQRHAVERWDPRAPELSPTEEAAEEDE